MPPFFSIPARNASTNQKNFSTLLAEYWAFVARFEATFEKEVAGLGLLGGGLTVDLLYLDLLDLAPADERGQRTDP